MNGSMNESLNPSRPGPPGLGYVYYPPEHPRNPGHPRLDIFLRSEPTQEHFDPERVIVKVVSAYGGLEELRITHPWEGQRQHHVAAGRVIMQDRIGKEAESFCFGGKLTVQTEAGQEPTLTTCVLTSPAPILALDGTSAASLLATEVEVVLAERRAAWLQEPDELERRLAAADPLLLYHALLDELRSRFRHHLPSEDPAMQRFLHFVRVESQAIRERDHLPQNTPTLVELL